MELCEVDSPLSFPHPILVLSASDCLQWYPDTRDEFYACPDEDEELRGSKQSEEQSSLQRLRAWLKTLPDGAVIPMRGRDWSGPRGDCTPWEYGYSVIVKQLIERGEGDYYAVTGNREEVANDNGKQKQPEQRVYSNIMYFLYESGKMEYFAIDVLNFVDLVHLKLAPVEKMNIAASSTPNGASDGCTLNIIGSEANVICHPSNNTTESCSTATISVPQRDHVPKSLLTSSNGAKRKVVVISHGYSEQLGPNYPVIRTLELAARRLGWVVIIPDFRDSYKYQHHRDRSERVRIIYSELLCLPEKPDTLVLVGHSQGGAASAMACESRVVKSQNIKGLLMIATENPKQFDGMNWKPEVSNILFIHPEMDQVVWPVQVDTLARDWKAPFITVSSPISRKQLRAHENDGVDYHGDCIFHDFLAKGLMGELVVHFEKFLNQCENS